MKNIQKLLSCAVVLTSLVAVSTTGAAVKTTQAADTKTSNVEITTSINPTYTVLIPENTKIKFNDTSTDFGEVKLSSAQINPGKCVQVSVKAGSLANETDAAKTIPYKVMAGTKEFSSATYKAAGDKTTLTIAIAEDAWNKAYAGSYSGTVTFEISYVDAN